jgi:HTH-type transcriptional regulator / antitoxin HigA
MKQAASDLKGVPPAWRALELRVPVKLRKITTLRHYKAMVRFMERLLDEVGDDERHTLYGLLDVVTALVHEYEQHSVRMPEAKPSDVLRLLMTQHTLRQIDLAELFGTQSNVSEVLSGKRSINARQARALADRFGVSPAIFI